MAELSSCGFTPQRESRQVDRAQLRAGPCVQGFAFPTSPLGISFYCRKLEEALGQRSLGAPRRGEAAFPPTCGSISGSFGGAQLRAAL